MPWVCGGCETEVPRDDLAACPSCGAQKEAWSVVAARTRTLVVSPRRFELLRGTGTEARPPAHPEAAATEVEEAPEVRALQKADLRRTLAAGRVPASLDVLFVRVHAAGAPDLTVTVTPGFEARELEELPFPPFPGAGDPVDVPFVFVRGEGDVRELSLPGVHVVDLTDDTPEGCTPTVEFRALKKPARALPVVHVDRAGGPVVPLFVIGGAPRGTLVRNCYAHVKPVVEGAAPARTFWIGAEGKPDPEAEGELVDGVRYALHWRYGEIQDPAAIPEGEWQEVDGGPEVVVRPRYAKGKLHVRLLRSAASPAREDATDDQEPTDEELARFRSDAPIVGTEDAEPIEHQAEPPALEPVEEEALAGARYTLEGNGQLFEGSSDADGLLLHETVRLGLYRLEVDGQAFVVHATHAAALPIPVVVPAASSAQAAEPAPAGAAGAPAETSSPPPVTLAEVEAWRPRRHDLLAEHRRAAAEQEAVS